MGGQGPGGQSCIKSGMSVWRLHPGELAKALHVPGTIGAVPELHVCILLQHMNCSK